MINKVILLGNLGKDPEIRHLENGATVAQFTVATNENYKDKAGEWQTVTQWHNIVAWRYLAEMAERSLKKGGLVYIEGKISNRKYQDKDGNDRYISEVVANTLRSLERRENAEGGNFSAPLPAENPAQSSGSSKGPGSAPKKLEDFDEDDLPF